MVKRTKFQGVMNILSFNRHFYVFGLILLIGLAIVHLLNVLAPVIVLVCILAVLYGLIAPLVVSAYVYDFSGYYDLNWIKPSEQTDKPKIVNIHSGFDETSFILQEKFPNSDLKALDFYDPNNHTEKAIIRARKVTQKFPNSLEIETAKIPEKENTIDLVCLLSAAHEIRDHEERIQFFKECRRVCKPNGRVVVMEHLRDVPNFIAFTIGVGHFHSNKTWLNCFQKAGFSKIESQGFTPFLRTYNLTP